MKYSFNKVNLIILANCQTINCYGANHTHYNLLCFLSEGRHICTGKAKHCEIHCSTMTHFCHVICHVDVCCANWSD